MSLEVVINFPGDNTTSVAALQTPVADLPLVLTTNFGGTTAVNPVIFPNIQTTISLTSANNASLAEYTIVGTNLSQQIISEVLTGPNADTVPSVEQYHTIISITPNNAGVGIAISAGNIGPATSMWVNGDHFRPYAQTSIRAAVTGTMTYSLVQTLDDPLKTSTPDTFAIEGALTDATTSQFYYLTSPWGGIQAATSETTTGSVRIGILQQGIR
jgi:hypothetical protein